MSEEIKVENNECFCKSKGFRNFLTVSLGSFVGVFCALSLFSALNKPPMIIPHQAPCKCFHKHHFHQNHFNKMEHKKFIKEFRKNHEDFKKVKEEKED